jgi:alpha-1,3-mannosyltransferase
MVKTMTRKPATGAAWRFGRMSVEFVRFEDVLPRITRAIEQRQPLPVSFCNAHSVNIAAHDDEFVAANNDCLVLNDGIGLNLASRLLYSRPFPENLNGTDLIPALFRSAPASWRIFLLGAAPGVADRAAGVLQAAYPRHVFAGTHHGYFDPAEPGPVEAAIVAAKPDIVIIAMGQPLQEIYGHQLAGRIGCVVICAGAFLDFASGGVRRAPLWVRRLRAEWLFRLTLEPRRLARRYLIGNWTFALTILKQKFGRGV